MSPVQELHEPLGLTLRGLRVQDVDASTVGELAGLLARHGVVVLPDQDVDDTGFLAFLRRFGELVFTTGETPVDGFPDLNVISNVGRTTPPRSTFHTDSSYLRRPPAYTALRAVTIPARGGGTQFTDQYRAFDTLPDDLRRHLAGRTVTHVVTGVDPGALGSDDETAAEHPLFREHPVSGRTALFLTTPARCRAISGLSEREAAETVQLLFEHSTTADNTVEHSWSSGDVVMWDNGCVLHRADHSDVEGDRVMHRGMVGSYPATPA